jgi:hypothetical protein
MCGEEACRLMMRRFAGCGSCRSSWVAGFTARRRSGIARSVVVRIDQATTATEGDDVTDQSTVTCPRCGVNEYTPYADGAEWNDDAPFPALSRMDNETYICSACGMDEATRDMQQMPPVPKYEWPMGHNDLTKQLLDAVERGEFE